MESINQTAHDPESPIPNFLKNLNFIKEILVSAEANEKDENKKKEIQEAISFLENRISKRKARAFHR